MNTSKYNINQMIFKILFTLGLLGLILLFIVTFDYTNEWKM